VSGGLLPLSLTVPCKRTPSPGYPTGPLRRHTFIDPSRSHPLKIYLSLRAPVRKPPSCSLTGSPWTGILRHQSYWSTHSFIHLFIHSVVRFVRSFVRSRMSAESPKRSPPTYGGKIRSPSMEPHPDGRPTYNGVRPGSPRVSLTTLLSLLQCHAAFSTISSALAWVNQSPVSQRVS
jgi:hypothetical protein